jgi:hypothetical protein
VHYVANWRWAISYSLGEGCGFTGAFVVLR